MMSEPVEEIGTVVVCQGPPLCEMEGDEAVQNQIDGCPLCKRIVIYADGTEREYQDTAN